MAFIKELAVGPRKTLSVHRTQVVCFYTVDRLPSGQKLLQLDTHGSDDRAIPGKVSQTLQLDERQAKHLWQILGEAFDLK